MRVHGQEVPLLPEVGCAEVVVAERVHLAPRTEVRVRCRLSRAMHGLEGMVERKESLRLADSMVFEWSLVQVGEELVMVLVANLSNEAQKVPTGAKLGTCEEVERPEETLGSAEVAAVRSLPDLLEDLGHQCRYPDGGTDREGAPHPGSVRG